MIRKLEELSQKIPTTADRMSIISALFPDGHGPSVEAVKEQTQIETQYLDSFRVALSSMKSELADLRSKQDGVCREYEREAAIIEQQISEQDVDAGIPPVKDDSLNFPFVGLSEAEVIFLFVVLFMFSFLFFN